MDQAKVAEKIVKKTREEKLREQKIESEVLKSLAQIQDPEQKFQALLKKFVESERICRSSLLLQKQLLSDKDNLIADRERILSTKTKLESLCRELQNQNKYIKVSCIVFLLWKS